MSGYPQAIRALDSAPRSQHETAGVTSFVSLLLPGFCTVVFVVALVQVLFLSQGAQGLFRDSDTGWHVLNGEAVLKTLSAPRVDTFSYTQQAQAWFAWEWLSDALIGGAHRIAGLPGVAFLAAVAIALTAWGAARLSLSLGGNLFFTAAAMVLLLGTTSIHWLARPHVFSWLFALVFLAAAEHQRFLYALPLVACLWANMHGSFLLGPAILFIYGFPGPSLASLVATFINPYGWRLHEHVFTYLQTDYLMDHIAEFRSFSFHSPGALYVELFLFVAVLGTVALLKQRAFGPVLLALGMLHISLYSARHLPTAAVLLLPLSVAALTREAREWPRLQPMLDYSERLLAIDRKIWGVVPVILVLAVSAPALDGRVGFDPAKFPVGAAEFMEQQQLDGHVFTKDQWGGYLIYRFGGRTKVFIDGRSDFYGQNFLETYAQVADVKPGWQAVLKQYDVAVVLMPADHALASALTLSPDWKRLYADSVASVFERKN